MDKIRFVAGCLIIIFELRNEGLGYWKIVDEKKTMYVKVNEKNKRLS